MPHPHGQIYGYSFVPKKLELETSSAKEYYDEKKACLFCDWLKNEEEAEKRIIFKNEHFTVFLPFFTEYPYGIYIMSNSHKQYITDFTDEEKTSLALTIKQAAGTLDSLFDTQFPYIRITSYNVCYTKLLRYSSYWMEVNSNGSTAFIDALFSNKYTISNKFNIKNDDNVIYSNDTYNVISYNFV